MKQEYKDLMMKYLDENPGIEVSSNPIGWYRNLDMVDDVAMDYRTSTMSYIRENKLEQVMVGCYVRDRVPYNHTSFKVVYDKDQKAFVGKYKTRDDNSRHVNVEIEVPEDIWFDTADLRINVNGKSSITTDITFNVRNGMFPKNIDEIRKQMELDISKKVSEQLQGKGKARKNIIRLNGLRYNKTLTANFVCRIITHDNNNLTIKL
jgi:hypothetical protein